MQGESGAKASKMSDSYQPAKMTEGSTNMSASIAVGDGIPVSTRRCFRVQWMLRG